MPQFVRGAAAILTVIAVAPTGGCSGDDDAATPATTTTTEYRPVSATRGLRDVLSRDDEAARFLEFADLADLWSRLPEGQDVTVLVPDSAAFDATDPALLESWRASPGDELLAVLSRHVIVGRVALADLVAAARGPGTIATLGGEPIPVTYEVGDVYAGRRLVRKYDIAFRRGYIHVLDGLAEPV